MTKYALYSYSTSNIGDEIQSVAALRFLPRVDYFINRDYMNTFSVDTDEEIKLIMNGWYTHRPGHFPPQIPQLKPLLTSMYIDDPIQEALLTEEMLDFLKANGPVGARSIGTLDLLEKRGVASYLSGCLTLTLLPDKSIKKRDFILALDIPNEAYDKLVKDSKLPVIRMSADIKHQYMTDERKLKLAQYYLYLYQSARYVVTTRLHGTLPCLALGTPVLNLELPGFEPSRFNGLRELANHMTIEAFMNLKPNEPGARTFLENPTDFLEIREKLENICRHFTGFDSQKGFLRGQDVTDFLSDPELIQSMTTGVWSASQRYGVHR